MSIGFMSADVHMYDMYPLRADKLHSLGNTDLAVNEKKKWHTTNQLDLTRGIVELLKTTGPGVNEVYNL